MIDAIAIVLCFGVAGLMAWNNHRARVALWVELERSRQRQREIIDAWLREVIAARLPQK